MNSLVVLFSMMVLVAAKPSGFNDGGLKYAVPAIAVAPAAVSHQSRVDIKSSPAVVETEVVAPVSRAIIANQPIIGVSATYTAPAVYSAPLVGVPAAVSSQSRLDIKSSPGIVNNVAVSPVVYSTPIAAPVAYSASSATPLSYGAPITAPLVYGASLTAPIAYTAPLASYSAIVSSPVIPEAPGASQPAELPVAPTETPEVAAARAAHLEAKALEESHQIQKRSADYVPLAPVVSTYAGVPQYPLIHPVSRLSPIGLPVPIYSTAYGLHPY